MITPDQARKLVVAYEQKKEEELNRKVEEYLEHISELIEQRAAIGYKWLHLPVNKQLPKGVMAGTIKRLRDMGYSAYIESGSFYVEWKTKSEKKS